MFNTNVGLLLRLWLLNCFTLIATCKKVVDNSKSHLTLFLFSNVTGVYCSS